MLLNCARVGGKNRSATFSCEKAGTHSQLGHDQHICIVVDRQGRVAFLEDGNSRRGVRLRGPHALPSTCDCFTSEAWSEPPSSAIYTNVWGLFNPFFVHCSPTSGACHRTGSGNQSFAALREAKSGVEVAVPRSAVVVNGETTAVQRGSPTGARGRAGVALGRWGEKSTTGTGLAVRRISGVQRESARGPSPARANPFPAACRCPGVSVRHGHDCRARTTAQDRRSVSPESLGRAVHSASSISARAAFARVKPSGSAHQGGRRTQHPDRCEPRACLA